MAEKGPGRSVLMVAGEVSGDLHGAHLVEAVRAVAPETRFFGMGGRALRLAGMEVLFPCEPLSVVGITEVAARLGIIFRTLKGLKEALVRRRPDLVILIDFPDFNLRVARAASRAGIPVLYYVSPQVWAWRRGRVRQIRRWVRKMAVLFPFEVPIYEAAGVDVTWVGHPLLDQVNPFLTREEASERFGLDPGRRIVGLLPGSRLHEVERLLPVFLDAAALMRQAMPDVQFVVARAPGLSDRLFAPLGEERAVPVRIVEGASHEVMALSDLLVMASGTATLEGAILGKPMVIAYRVSRLTYWVGRALIRGIRYIGLVNLVAEKRVAPELIQDEANPERVAAEALRFLGDPDLYGATVEALAEVRRRLGEPGAATRAARIVLDMLGERK
jgi:lipid-A-disaccharide synthase